jgi:hypothetical protein
MVSKVETCEPSSEVDEAEVMRYCQPTGRRKL